MTDKFDPAQARAIVVGIERYSTGIRELRNACQVALRFINWLLRVGVNPDQISVLLSDCVEPNATPPPIPGLTSRTKAMDKWLADKSISRIPATFANVWNVFTQVRQCETLLVFWAGHGYLTNAIDDRRLALQDSTSHAPLNWSLRQAESYLRTPERVLWVVDACASWVDALPSVTLPLQRGRPKPHFWIFSTLPYESATYYPLPDPQSDGADPQTAGAPDFTKPGSLFDAALHDAIDALSWDTFWGSLSELPQQLPAKLSIARERCRHGPIAAQMPLIVAHDWQRKELLSTRQFVVMQATHRDAVPQPQLKDSDNTHITSFQETLSLQAHWWKQWGHKAKFLFGFSDFLRSGVQLWNVRSELRNADREFIGASLHRLTLVSVAGLCIVAALTGTAWKVYQHFSDDAYVNRVVTDLLTISAPTAIKEHVARHQNARNGCTPLLLRRLDEQLGPTLTSDARSRGKIQSTLQSQRAEALLILSQAALGNTRKLLTALSSVDASSVRTYVLFWSPLVFDDPAPLCELLPVDPTTVGHDAAVGAQGLILALGCYDVGPLSKVQITKDVTFVNWLEQAAMHSEHPGLRSSAEWLLQQLNHKSGVEKVQAHLKFLTSSQDDERESASAGAVRWFADSAGILMVSIPAQRPFVVGDGAADEQDSDPDRLQHKVTIPQAFAISIKEVTNREFRQFLDATAGLGAEAAEREVNNPISLAGANVDLDVPVSGVSWEDAAIYCNWLSGKHELQRCYALVDNRITPIADAEASSGYRLPTELEWECACRADTVAIRFLGNALEFVRQFAWKGENGIGPTSKVGSMRPNQFGLFDVYGNASEWCHNQFQQFPRDRNTIIRADRSRENAPGFRTYRGGRAGQDEAGFTSSGRSIEAQDHWMQFSGFRVARTLVVPP